MTLNDYSDLASETAVYPKKLGLLYAALGLASEAGEVAGEIKKMIRDDGGRLGPIRKKRLVLELGDTLWYIAAIAQEINVPLEEVARANIHKLRARAGVKGPGTVGEYQGETWDCK